MKVGYSMYLHNDKENFIDIITATAEHFTIPEEQVEKDYYVSHLLAYLVKQVPSIVFKGGTSLSKCYGVVKRFSEDIDVHYASDKKLTQGEKKQFKEKIIGAIKDAQLEHLNPEDIRSRRDHNNYIVGFPQQTEHTGTVRNYLLVETFIPIKVFPTEVRSVSSYILEFLEEENENDIIKKYRLQSFDINVQRIDRTFIDKLFAICDYYEQEKFNRNSRHLYDLYKIIESDYFNKDGFNTLFEQVKIERQKKPETNLSSKSGYKLKQTIEFILKKDLYREDYEDITQTLLFEDISYDIVKESLYRLLNEDLIPESV